MQATQQVHHHPQNDFDRQYRIPFQQTERWKQYLKENGFVVVRNFIKRELCQQFMNQVWEMMEKLSLGKLKRNDPQTHKHIQNYPSSHHGGLMQYIGHAKFQWQIRKLVKQIYQELWGTKQLKCSFDGVCFSNGALDYKIKSEHEGIHVDQAPHKTHFQTYQGSMSLTDAGTNGGGFVCLPKPGKFFAQYFKPKNLSHKCFRYNVTDDELYKQPFCNYQKVNVQAGDFILWDSRTFHCGCPPANLNLRVATYVAMFPQKEVSLITKQKRIKAFHQRQNSGHHAGDGFRTFPKIPRRNILTDKEELQKFSEAINQLNQLHVQDLQKEKQIMQLV